MSKQEHSGYYMGNIPKWLILSITVLFITDTTNQHAQ